MKGFLSRFCDKESNVPSKDIKELTVAIRNLSSSIENNNHKSLEIHQEKNGEKPEEKSNTVWNILEKWKTILTFGTSFSIFIGAIIIYNYLMKIESLALFSEIVSSPSLLISTVIFFFILISFVFIFPFYTPYLVADSIKNLGGRKTAFFANTFGTILTVAILFGAFLITKDLQINETITFNTILTVVILLIVAMLFICCITTRKLDKKIFSYEGVNLFLMSLTQHLAFLFICLFSYFFIAGGWFENTDWFLIWVLVFYVANIFALGIISFENNKKGSNDLTKLILSVPLFFIALMSFTLASIPGSNVSTNLLNRLGFIQQPDDAQWYVLDNRFIEWYKLQANTSEQTYSFHNWKEKFQPTEAKEKARNLSKNPNTLYGYMAWNVGGTKIFCPKSVELPKETEAKDKRHAIKFSTQCLTIKGDYLQPLPTGL